MPNGSEPSALICNIQPFSIHDGPGIRTTVFFKGCNLRCYWCHNPESISPHPEVMSYPQKCIGCGACAQVCPQGGGVSAALFTPDCLHCGSCAESCFAGSLELSGKNFSLTELLPLLFKDKDVYQRSGGGVTFSGGDPLLQFDFVLEAAQALKKEQVPVAIESALNVPWTRIEPLLPYVDLFFFDLKHPDDARHREGTGVGNRQILENIQKLCASGANCCLRIPVIPSFNDDESTLAQAARWICSLPHRPPVELLPFHGLCVGKYDALHRPYAAQSLAEPTASQMDALTQIFLDAGLVASHR